MLLIHFVGISSDLFSEMSRLPPSQDILILFTGLLTILVLENFFQLLIYENIKHTNVNLAIVSQFTNGLPV